MKKLIIGVTAAIMLAGASVYAANSTSKKSDNTTCEKNCCPACPGCDDCTCCDCCSK